MLETPVPRPASEPETFRASDVAATMARSCRDNGHHGANRPRGIGTRGVGASRSRHGSVDREASRTKPAKR